MSWHFVLGTALCTLVTLAGCGVTAPDRLECTSMGDTPRTLALDEGKTTYLLEVANTEFVRSSLEPEAFDQHPIPDGYLLHAELLWIPKAGKTAIDPQATNLSLRLVVFSGGEVGLYGGGGFAWPQGDAGSPQYGLDLVGSNLTLLAATKGFVDLLSPSQMTGRLLADLDPQRTRLLRRAASQSVTNALKSVQWVGPIPVGHPPQVPGEATTRAATDRIPAVHGEHGAGISRGSTSLRSVYSQLGGTSGAPATASSWTISQLPATESKSSATWRAGATGSSAHSSHSSRTIDCDGSSPGSAEPPGANSHIPG